MYEADIIRNIKYNKDENDNEKDINDINKDNNNNNINDINENNNNNNEDNEITNNLFLMKNIISNTVLEETLINDNIIINQYKSSRFINHNIVFYKDTILTKVKIDWDNTRNVIYVENEYKNEDIIKINEVINSNGLNGDFYLKIKILEDILKFDLKGFSIIMDSEQLRPSEIFIAKRKNKLKNAILTFKNYIDWNCVEYVLKDNIEYILIILDIETIEIDKDNICSVIEQSLPFDNIYRKVKFDINIRLKEDLITESFFLNNIFRRLRNKTKNIMRISKESIFPDRLNLIDELEENNYTILFSMIPDFYKNILYCTILLDDLKKYKLKRRGK